MAKYHINFDEETGVTYIALEGELVREEFLAFMQSDSFRDRTARVLCDLSKANLESMPSGEIMKALRDVRPLGKSGIRAAYFLAKGANLSKIKSMLAQLEVLQYDGVYMLFTDKDKALDWLLGQ